MKHISAKELQRNIGDVQDMALIEPVAITRHGRERLVLMSVEEYGRLKLRDRRSYAIEELPEWLVDEFSRAEIAVSGVSDA